MMKKEGFSIDDAEIAELAELFRKAEKDSVAYTLAEGAMQEYMVAEAARMRAVVAETVAFKAAGF